MFLKVLSKPLTFYKSPTTDKETGNYSQGRQNKPGMPDLRATSMSQLLTLGTKSSLVLNS